MAAVPSKEVTTRQISAVSFGFYSDSEVRNFQIVVFLDDPRASHGHLHVSILHAPCQHACISRI